MKNSERIESTRQRVMRGFRRYCVIVVMLTMILSFAMPVSAAGDPLTVINNLSTFNCKLYELACSSHADNSFIRNSDTCFSVNVSADLYLGTHWEGYLAVI